MSQLAFANGASSTLGAAITNVAVSITVAPGTGVLFPAIGSGQMFLATIFPATGSSPAPEIVLVTARATDVLTVVRARESTTAQAWGVGAIISQLNTAGTMGDLLQCVTYAGNPNGYVGGVAATATTPPSLVWDSANAKLWFCITTGPAATAGWSPIYALLAGSSSQVFNVAPATADTHAVSRGELDASTAGGTANAITLTILGVTSYSQIVGLPITFNGAVGNSGPTTINVNGLGALNLYQGGVSLSGGELVNPWSYTVVCGGSSFNLMGSSNGPVNVGAATAPTHAVNFGQINSPMQATSGRAFGTNTTLSVWASFTAPSAGVLYAIGGRNNDQQAAYTNTADLYINGTMVDGDNTLTTATHFGSAVIGSGGAVNAEYNASCTVAFSINVTLIFIPNV